MSRLQAKFSRLREQGRKALIPYITAGDPEPSVTVPLMHALVRSGADVLELGVPFSDPMADGPVIQRATERALRHGVSLDDVLAMVRSFRDSGGDCPVVLMGYLNPLEVMGYASFAQAAGEAGVDGVLLVDMPPEEAGEWLEAARHKGIDPIFLLAPTSTSERIARICSVASGYVYYVSLKGVSGAATLDVDEVRERLTQIRSHTDLPIGVGFGIRDAESAARVAQTADAVIVGSAIVQRMGDLADDIDRIPAVVSELVSGMRRAIDAA
jgi:tryptophan synthase alpha chain